MSNRYKIGYIDEKPEQVTIFKHALQDFEIDVIGYDIIQGMSLDDILEQAYSSNIDLLMIDFLLTDNGILNFNGDAIERKFNALKPGFPHIIFTSEEADAFDSVDNPNIIYEKEKATNPETVKKFADTLKKIVENYRKYISTRKEKISILLEKGESIGLSAQEKHDLINLQNELLSLDKKKQDEVPNQLLFEDRIENLSRTKKEAEAFLQNLLQQRKK